MPERTPTPHPLPSGTSDAERAQHRHPPSEPANRPSIPYVLGETLAACRAAKNRPAKRWQG